MFFLGMFFGMGVMMFVVSIFAPDDPHAFDPDYLDEYTN